MSSLGVRQRGRGGFDGSFVRIVVAILVMFVHSVAGISTFSTISQVTHPDIGNRVNDQPVVSALLDCLRNERDGRQETTREDPFLDKVDFTLIYPSA
jgi:hypothetical protein